MILNDSATLSAINGAKKILRKRFEDFYAEPSLMHSKYSKVYFWTNENINAYLNLFDISDKENALTVLASGDHAFNLITNGVTNIDTFDSNILTEYYVLGLKRAMILKYNYYNFIKNMGKLNTRNLTSPEETYAIIRGLYPFMEHHHKVFWESLINYDYKLRQNKKSWYNLLELLIMHDAEDKSRFYNTYLLNDEYYNTLRSKLSSANISFKYANAKDLDREFKGNNYDLILLSNILDYFQNIFCDSWGYSSLKEYEDKLDQIAKEHATIFLKYVYGYRYVDEQEPPISSARLFRYSSFNTSQFTSEEIIEIPKLYSDSKDAIILRRIRKNDNDGQIHK